MTENNPFPPYITHPSPNAFYALGHFYMTARPYERAKHKGTRNASALVLDYD